jgi:hypothetical protein
MNAAPRGWLRKLAVPGTIILLLVTVFILNCSGLAFPLWGARRNLERSFSNDFAVALPTSAVVEKAVYVAQMDKSEFFLVRMPVPDLEGWIAALKTSAQKNHYDIEDLSVDKRHFIGMHGPAWYVPQSLPDEEGLKVHLPPNTARSSDTGYWLFYSRKTGQVFIYWYTT